MKTLNVRKRKTGQTVQAPTAVSRNQEPIAALTSHTLTVVITGYVGKKHFVALLVSLPARHRSMKSILDLFGSCPPNHREKPLNKPSNEVRARNDNVSENALLGSNQHLYATMSSGCELGKIFGLFGNKIGALFHEE